MAAAKACDFSRSSFLLSRTSSWVRENAPSVLEWKMREVRNCRSSTKRFYKVFVVQKTSHANLSQTRGTVVSDVIVEEREENQSTIQSQSLMRRRGDEHHRG